MYTVVMVLEIQRRRLDRPPLGTQEERSPEQMLQGELRTEAPLSEYIDTRERHMQRTVLEVLQLSGLSFEDSTKLAEVILNLHREEWYGNTDLATERAIEGVMVPTTPFDQDAPNPIRDFFENAPLDEYTLTPEENEQIKNASQEYKEGKFISLGAMMRYANGEIPVIRIEPE